MSRREERLTARGAMPQSRASSSARSGSCLSRRRAPCEIASHPLICRCPPTTCPAFPSPCPRSPGRLSRLCSPPLLVLARRCKPRARSDPRRRSTPRGATRSPRACATASSSPSAAHADHRLRPVLSDSRLSLSHELPRAGRGVRDGRARWPRHEHAVPHADRAAHAPSTMEGGPTRPTWCAASASRARPFAALGAVVDSLARRAAPVLRADRFRERRLRRAGLAHARPAVRARAQGAPRLRARGPRRAPDRRSSFARRKSRRRDGAPPQGRRDQRRGPSRGDAHSAARRTSTRSRPRSRAPSSGSAARDRAMDRSSAAGRTARSCTTCATAAP